MEHETEDTVFGPVREFLLKCSEDIDIVENLAESLSQTRPRDGLWHYRIGTVLLEIFRVTRESREKMDSVYRLSKDRLLETAQTHFEESHRLDPMALVRPERIFHAGVLTDTKDMVSAALALVQAGQTPGEKSEVAHISGRLCWCISQCCENWKLTSHDYDREFFVALLAVETDEDRAAVLSTLLACDEVDIYKDSIS
jgi:hypothetical protein